MKIRLNELTIENDFRERIDYSSEIQRITKVKLILERL